jgi:hypothetical protein
MSADPLGQISTSDAMSQQHAFHHGAWLRRVDTDNGHTDNAPPCSKGPGDRNCRITLAARCDEAKLEQGTQRITRPMQLEVITELVIAAALMDVVYAQMTAATGAVIGTQIQIAAFDVEWTAHSPTPNSTL